MDERKKQEIAGNVLEVSKRAIKKIVKSRKLPWPEHYSETFWDIVYKKHYDDLLIHRDASIFVSSQKQEYFVEQAGNLVEDFASEIAWLSDAAIECRKEIASPLKVFVEKAAEDRTLAEEVKKLLVYIRKLESSLAEAGKRAEVNLSRVRELKRELRLDELTLTLNRRALFKDLEIEMKKAKRYGYPVSAFMVDIDYFKTVNDRYGHQAGDLILAHVAKIMEECIREADSLYRYGGEEFFILLPHVDLKGGAIMAERFRRVIESCSFLLDRGKTRVSITVSIGGTQMLENEESTGSFIDRADDALYKAKKQGRNQIVCI